MEWYRALRGRLGVRLRNMLRRPGTRRRLKLSEGFPGLPESRQVLWIEEEWTGKRWSRIAEAADERALEQAIKEKAHGR